MMDWLSIFGIIAFGIVVCLIHDCEDIGDPHELHDRSHQL
jgi:hypothetical protein